METSRFISEGLLAAALLLPALALAQPLEPAPSGPPLPAGMAQVTLVDPLDGHVFEAPVVISTNGLGGYDSDGCAYSRGRQPRTFAVATSPTTLYSGLVDRWTRAIPPERAEPLRRTLLELGRSVDDARSLLPPEQYEIAARVAEELGDSDYAIGELFLSAAWTWRDTVVGFLPGVQGASDAWKKLAQTTTLARREKEPGPRTMALFDLARLAHRGGFVVERDGFLATLDSFDDAGLGGQEKRAEFLRRVEEEDRLLRRAMDRFEAGLRRADGTPTERAYYRYLVGDLARRLGEFDKAASQLEAVALDPSKDDAVGAYVKDIQRVLKLQAKAASELEGLAPIGSADKTEGADSGK